MKKLREILVDTIETGGILLTLVGYILSLVFGILSGLIVKATFFSYTPDVSNISFGDLTFHDIGQSFFSTIVTWGVGIAVFVFCIALTSKFMGKSEQLARKLGERWHISPTEERRAKAEKEAEAKQKAWEALPIQVRLKARFWSFVKLLIIVVVALAVFTILAFFLTE